MKIKITDSRLLFITITAAYAPFGIIAFLVGAIAFALGATGNFVPSPGSHAAFGITSAPMDGMKGVGIWFVLCTIYTVLSITSTWLSLQLGLIFAKLIPGLTIETN